MMRTNHQTGEVYCEFDGREVSLAEYDGLLKEPPEPISGLPVMTPPNDEQMEEWREWVAERPTTVRPLCEKFPPWNYYDMPKTGQVVTVDSYNENGTMTVTVVGDQISIPAIVSFGVFGVLPEDLIKRAD